MRRIVVATLASTLAMVVVQAALVVYQNNSLPGVYAERFNVADAFSVESPDFGVASATQSALGVEGNEVAMAATFPAARTALTLDNWKYAAVVKETAVNSVTTGSFQAQLYMNDVLQGSVFIKAGTDPAAVEGATVTWNLGASIDAAPLFVVKLTPFVQTAPLMEFAIKSAASGPSWVGVSAPTGHASIAGLTNPALNVAVGDMAKLTWTNDDGGFHNLAVKNAGGTDVAGPTATVSTQGQSAVLTYTTTAAGTYTYYCKMHPSTMTGSLVVA